MTSAHSITRFALCGLVVLFLFISAAQTGIARSVFSDVKTASDEGAPSTEMPSIVPGNVIVKLQSERDAEDLHQAVSAREHGLDQRLSLPSRMHSLESTLNAYDVKAATRIAPSTNSPTLRQYMSIRVEGVSSDDTWSLVAELNNDPLVLSAEPNRIVELTALPNDTYYGTKGAWSQSFWDLWGLQVIGLDTGATEWMNGGERVTVAVIDTGLDMNHPDIAENVWVNQKEADSYPNGIDDDNNGYIDDVHGWDIVNNDNDPTDDNGHGTHVSGTIAAVGNNGTGIIGVSPKSKIMPLKAFNAGGRGTMEDIVEAMLYAANNGARVTNGSFGGCCGTSELLQDTLDYTHSKKQNVFVAAAGNLNRDIGMQYKGFWPASFRKVIAVAASDHLDQKASFSNFGQQVDVIAPGGGDEDPVWIFHPYRSILSLRADQSRFDSRLNIGDHYLRQGGTSMAAPHVSGVAALLLSQDPTLTPEQVRQGIRKGSDDILANGYDWFSGYGRLNAAEAMALSDLPAARLLGPLKELVGGREVQITGYAYGPAFSHWTLEYAEGTEPQGKWSVIAESTEQVKDDTLLTSWQVPDFSPGFYTVRLTVFNDDGSSFEDRLTLKFDPSLRTGWPVTLSSSLDTFTDAPSNSLVFDDVNDDGYADLPVADGKFVHMYDANGNELPGWPKQSVDTSDEEAFVAGPAIGDVNGDDIKDVVTITQGSATVDPEIYVWDRDGNLLHNWPQPLEANQWYWSRPHVTISDLDGDGESEIIVSKKLSSSASKLWVWRGDGTLFPGWPQEFDGGIGQVLTADIDTNGLNDLIYGVEEVAYGQNRTVDLFVVDSQGTPLTGWPVTIGGDTRLFGTPQPAIADITGDGSLDIVIGSWGGVGAPSSVYALNKEGDMLLGWPVQVLEGALSQAVVGDITNDGVAEVVITGESEDGNFGHQIFVFNGSGRMVPGWPAHVPSSGNSLCSPMPILADVDGDGSIDVLMHAQDMITAFTANGKQTVAGFPKFLLDDVCKSSHINTSPAVGDADGDGLLELTWVSSNQYWLAGSDPRNYVYMWDLEGRADAKSCPWGMFMHDASHTGLSTKKNWCVPFLPFSPEPYLRGPGL